jgi:adenylate kinase family enzyme
MAGPRLHITGASGCGVSSLGTRLAEALQVPQLDTDDFYWQRTDPPFTDKNPIPERIRLLSAAMGAGGWVISGALEGWGTALIEEADLVVFLTLPRSQRLARLIRRERRLHGARIDPGGDMARIHSAFLDWAAQYDDPGFTGRSRARHEAWLMDLSVPVLRLDAGASLDELVQAVLGEVG